MRSDTLAMTPPAETVVCYSCGARQDASAEDCSKCQAGFRRLCSCGATCSMFADRCPSCGVPVRRARRQERKRPVKAIALAAVVLLVAGGAGAVWWRHARGARVSTSGAKAAAGALFQSGRFEDAQKAFAKIDRKSVV
jgi:ribosomal protein L40E